MTKYQFKGNVCKMKNQRVHLCSKEREKQELIEMLLSARKCYLSEVESGEKSYERYAEDYICRNTFVNSTCALCKNAHLVNLNIVKGLLMNKRDLLDKYLFCENYSLASIDMLMRIYNGLPIPHSSENDYTRKTISFDCALRIEQIVELTELIRMQGMFRINEVSVELVANLFQCKEGLKITIQNLRKTSVMFDAMANRNMITSAWQSIIVKGRFFQSKKDGKDITRENLANSLSSARQNGMSYIKVINEWVDNIKNLSK